MMKKTKQTYVQPTCEVVELHVTNQLLNASPETQVTNTMSKKGDYELEDSPF